MKRTLALIVALFVIALSGCTWYVGPTDPAPPSPPSPPAEPNKAPVALFSVSHAIPHVGQEVTFDALASRDYDGWIESYRWDLGPAGVQTDSVVTVTFDQAGSWWISLTVTDNEGETGTNGRLLTVVDPPGDGGCGCSGGSCDGSKAQKEG